MRFSERKMINTKRNKTVQISDTQIQQSIWSTYQIYKATHVFIAVVKNNKVFCILKLCNIQIYIQ